MVRSTDNGVTWSGHVDSSTSAGTFARHHPSTVPGVGWAVGGPSLLKSADGGTSWKSAGYPQREPLVGQGVPVRCGRHLPSSAATMTPVAAAVVRSNRRRQLVAAVTDCGRGTALKARASRISVHAGGVRGPHANLYATKPTAALPGPPRSFQSLPSTRLSMATIYGVAFTSASTWIASSISPPNPKSSAMPWGYYILTTTDGGRPGPSRAREAIPHPVLWAVASSGRPRLARRCRAPNTPRANFDGRPHATGHDRPRTTASGPTRT